MNACSNSTRRFISPNNGKGLNANDMAIQDHHLYIHSDDVGTDDVGLTFATSTESTSWHNLSIAPSGTIFRLLQG